MSNKGHKDKVKYKSKLRKRQVDNANKTSVTEQTAEIIEGARSRLKQKLIEMNGENKHKVVESAHLEKMSDILIEYAQPFIDSMKTDEKGEYEKSIEISMMLWNCAIMGESLIKRRQIMKMLKPVMPDAESKKVVKYMLERKREMYPDNRRMMLNYEVTELPDGGYHLTVGSTLDKASAKKYTENLQNMT